MPTSTQAMQATMICNTCDRPGSFETATECVKARSNVREFGQELFTLWRCDQCRTIHSLEPIDPEKYYKDYPVHNQKVDIFTRMILRNRLSFMTKLGVRRSHAILDYGCGEGLFVDYLKSKRYTIQGHDPYTEKYSQAIHPDARFDVVCSDQVIEHAADPGELIQTWADLVKPGGLLFIGCPNGEAIDLRTPERFIHELHQPYHRHLLSPRALAELAHKAGLRHLTTEQDVCAWQPFINWPFLRAYMQRTGGFLDALYEPPDYRRIVTSPGLIARGLFGGLLPSRTLMVSVFTKAG